MRGARGRYLFTQLSAFVVFFVTVVIVFLLLGRAVDLQSWVRERPSSAFQLLGVFATVAVVVCIGIFGMALWGRALVVMGLLTKEEARGYPYSKPWERDRDVF